jgi:putative ABC transport system substrate-binding protein
MHFWVSGASMLKRREFISLLSGAAVAPLLHPLAARAQQGERIRRIGVLMNLSEDDTPGQRFAMAFRQGLKELGWEDGRNVRIDVRWGAGDRERYRRYAVELVTLAPDVILAATTDTVVALQETSRTVPIVFVGVVDPVGSGLIASMARPRGNATGFTVFEYAISAKWLELLKEIASRVTRAAVLRDAAVASGIGQFATIQAMAPVGMELSTIGVPDVSQVEQSIAAFAREPNGGLIVTASAFSANHPQLIATLAARHNLPAVYPFSFFVRAGGLISYGPDQLDQYRQAAGYVHRILKGEKPADLPVQAPTKYELVINLKTAKALGLTFPATLLALADEVIE